MHLIIQNLEVKIYIV